MQYWYVLLVPEPETSDLESGALWQGPFLCSRLEALCASSI
jgi:hypothetical protein